MSAIQENNEETYNDEHCLNSARDMKVVDFACFLNRRDTTHSKKKKERKSEVSNKIKNKLAHVRVENLEDKDVEDNDEDYVPIKFVNY
jgi:hypothetical protein